MGITEELAISGIHNLAKVYPKAKEFSYNFIESPENFYGSEYKGMEGAYSPKCSTRERNKIDLVPGNIENEKHLYTVLKHEFLGHYGINTFSSDNKKRLLKSISESEHDSLKEKKEVINKDYSDKTELEKAEEVYSFIAEEISFRDIDPNINEKALVSFNETCVNKDRPITLNDVKNITEMVALGLHQDTRKQQTFPERGQQFSIKKEKKPHYEVVSERLIKQLEEGTAPWQMPWKPGSLKEPHNPVSGTVYQGFNNIWLLMQGRSDPRWMTYKNAQSIGAQVKKGEKGSSIGFYTHQSKKLKRDEQGNPVKDDKGNKVYVNHVLARPIFTTSYVFNAEQIEGLEPLKEPEQTWESNERADNILKSSSAKIRHVPGNQAYYSPAKDEITLPDKEQFESSNNYYATALHELGHWTGHKSRLDRDLSGRFGSEEYAKEELRAEIASLMMGEKIGTGHDPGQHAAYVKSWIKILKEDPKEIYKASKDADKITQHIMEYEKTKSQDKRAVQDKVIEAANKFANEKFKDEKTKMEFINQIKERALHNNPEKRQQIDTQDELEL